MLQGEQTEIGETSDIRARRIDAEDAALFAGTVELDLESPFHLRAV